MKLKKLKEYIWENKEKIQEVVYRDLKKPSEEVLLTEIYPVISEIKYVIKNLKKWTRLQKMTTPISLFGAKSYYRFESKGVVLIISPWNYPFQLSIGPLITAIAAGNAVILKPSELSLNTSGYLKKLAVDVFDESEVAVIEGDAIVAQNL
jgi:aldehyde dehydrogenase (NAD+)